MAEAEQGTGTEAPATEPRKCVECGAEFVSPPKPGRPFAKCPDCRGGTEKAVARQAAKKALGNLKSLSDGYKASRLAAGLRMANGDLRRAAEYARLAELSDAELQALEVRARAEFQDTIDGKPQGSVRLIEGGVHMIVTDLVAGVGSIAPRDMAHVGRALGQLRDLLTGGQNIVPYTTLVLEVTGPGGEKIVFGADEKAGGS